MTTVFIFVAFFVVWLVFLRPMERAREERLDFQRELRCPTLNEYSPEGDTFRGETFVDFEKMLLVDVSSDYDCQHTRVFHLRRLDGPVWERCEEADSRGRSTAHREQQRADGWDEDQDRDRFLDDPSLWEPLGPSALEAPYQRFLHQYDSKVVFPNPQWRLDLAVAGDFVKGAPRPKFRPGR